jgi:signal recognition particle GTPase
MVLAELGASITSALSKATKSKSVDSALLDEILKDIATALLSADVNVKLVASLRANVKKRVNLEELGTGLNVERVINEAVFKELVAILDPGVPKKNPMRGKQNVVLFVGLQGAGKVGAHLARSVYCSLYCIVYCSLSLIRMFDVSVSLRIPFSAAPRLCLLDSRVGLPLLFP